MKNSGERSSFLKSSSGVASANLASRLLGMVRDICFAYFLGASTLMSAWVMAFSIPNLFRRLLGEGALGTVLVPIISHDLHEKNGKKKASRNFMLLFILLGIFLGLISILTVLVCLVVAPKVETERLKLLFQTLPVVMPYSLFVCLSGITGSALNSLKKFFLPALTSLFLNISLICCLLFAVSGLEKGLSVLYSLSISVLFAGIIQLICMLFLLKKIDMISFESLSDSIKDCFSIILNKEKNPFLREAWRLVLPGLVGASALQISFLIDRFLALYLGNYAVPALYYSDRIVFITVGIFAVSMGSVLLPSMSRFAIKKDLSGMADAIQFGLRHLMFICVPAMFFTFFFREELIQLLFMRGKFNMESLNATSWALCFYALGIPFFASIKILLSGFYSRKDMKTPLKISIICIILNIVLNLILMWPLQQGGIALATVIAYVVNNSILLYLLKKDLKELKIVRILAPVFQFLLISYVSISLTMMCIPVARDVFSYYTFKYVTGLEVIPAAILFGNFYFLISLIADSAEIDEWWSIWKRRMKG